MGNGALPLPIKARGYRIAGAAMGPMGANNRPHRPLMCHQGGLFACFSVGQLVSVMGYGEPDFRASYGKAGKPETGVLP